MRVLDSAKKWYACGVYFALIFAVGLKLLLIPLTLYAVENVYKTIDVRHPAGHDVILHLLQRFWS